MATEETFLAGYTERRSARHHDREVLTFQLADEIFGVDVSSMREISKMRELTELPRVPAFLRGIITLRGVVVPVLDLRRRLSMGRVEPTRAARILIVDYEGEPFGLIVDRVRKVVRLDNSQIEPAPLAGGLESDFLAAVARTEGDLIALLNLPAVVQFALEVTK